MLHEQLFFHFIISYAVFHLISSPLVEEDGNDDAYDEDNSQHRAHHPDKAFLLIDDRLGVDVGWHNRVGVGACGIHDLSLEKPNHWSIFYIPRICVMIFLFSNHHVLLWHLGPHPTHYSIIVSIPWWFWKIVSCQCITLKLITFNYINI